MRAVIQRVSSAHVAIGGEVKAQIARGLLLLLGIESGDTAEAGQWLAEKIAAKRIFPDEAGLMNQPVRDVSAADEHGPWERDRFRRVRRRHEGITRERWARDARARFADTRIMHARP